MAKRKRRQEGKKTQPAKTKVPMSFQSPPWFTNRRLHAWVIFIFSVLLYANTLTHGYVQDDAIVITENMFTSEGVSGIPGILQYDTFYGFFKEEGKANLVAGGRYRPLSLVLFAIEVELFGLNPFVSHLINALLYGLTSVVLYWLLLQFFQNKKSESYVYFIALSGALLFAAHPLHTEVVANIKGRDEILALLGSLGALSLSLKAFYRKRQYWSLLAAAVFLLALFSKENAITFLAVVPLAYYFFTPAKRGTIARQSLPFFVVAIFFLIIRGSILGWGLSEPPAEMMNNPFIKVEDNRYVPFTAGERTATITYTLGKYVQLLVAPLSMTHDYYPRQVDVMSWSDWQVWASALLYLLLLGYALWEFRRRDPLSFGILYYLATLSIVSNLLFPVGTHMSERFVYMPSVAYCVIIGVLLYRVARKLAPTHRITTFRQLFPAFGLGLMLLALYSIRTVVRNPAWESNYALFTNDAAVSENSAKLQNAVGGELISQAIKAGNENRKDAMLREAVQHLQRATRIHPNYKNAHLLLGNAYYYLEQWDQAIQYYQQALRLDPDYTEASTNLAIAYRDAGRYYGEQQGNISKALQYLNKAYELRSNDYETLRLLGVANGIAGNTDAAIRYFSEAVELAPDSADALYNLGSAYYNAGQPEMGAEYHRRAIEKDPEVVERMGGNRG